jgi:hypothetical protein
LSNLDNDPREVVGGSKHKGNFMFNLRETIKEIKSPNLMALHTIRPIRVDLDTLMGGNGMQLRVEPLHRDQNAIK